MNIGELRRAIQPPTNNLYDAFFTRRLSILLTAALAPAGTTANQVSTANLFVGIGGCLLIALAGTLGVLAGVILLHLYAILDSVDGELARFRKQFSLKGLFLEDLSAFYVIVMFPLAVGTFVYRSGVGAETLILAIFYAVLGRNSMSVARRAVLRSVRTRRPISPTQPKRSQSRLTKLQRLVDEHLLNHTNIRVIVSTLLLVELFSGVPPRITAGLMSVVLLGLLVREALGIAHFVRTDSLETMLLDLYEDAKVVNTDPATADGFRLARN